MPVITASLLAFHGRSILSQPPRPVTQHAPPSRVQPAAPSKDIDMSIHRMIQLHPQDGGDFDEDLATAPRET
jgi:hypothetical protein